MVSSVLKYLIVYLALGRGLFPCRERHSGRLNADGTPRADAKSPFTLHGFKDASLDPDQWARWAEQYPDCAWGSPTTVEGTILDIDPRHGGDLTLKSWVAEHGELPLTPLVATGGGGWQHMLRFPFAVPNRSIGPGVDVKSVGGYGIVPPSRIYIPEHFRPYSFEVKPWHVPVADAPEWLVAKATAKPTTEKGTRPVSGSTAKATGSPWVVMADTPSASVAPWTVEPDADLHTHPGVPEGQRRVTLCRLVGTHLAKGDSPAAVWVWAEEWASRCRPAFDEWESHVAGLVRRAASVTAPAQHPLPSVPRSSFPVVVPASEETNSEEINSGSGLAVTGVSSGELVSSESVPPARATDTELVSSEGANANTDSHQPDADAGTEIRTGESVSFEGVSSPPVTAGIRMGVIRSSGSCSPALLFPVLHPDAYYGLFGEMLRAVEPETEAHPAGIMVSWLGLFGNIVGRGAWVMVGARIHYAVVFIGVGGRSSDAKGDTFSVAFYPYRLADIDWAIACIANGIGSGEGLIERVADALVTTDAKGNPVVIPGATDKRLVVRLSELSRCFKVGRRENATLSEYLREAWDGEPIHIPNRKGNALSASGYTISVIGDITPAVLGKLMANGTESVDGFANRFLWCMVRSPRSLPSGGNVSVLDPFVDRLKVVLAKAKVAGEVRRDADAERLWAEVYPSLKASADTVPHTDRARPYVVRLSLLYALADGERVIREPHLRAALAVWDYCRQSAAILFAPADSGGSPPAEPDPLWLQALSLIQSRPGIGRGEIVYALRHTAKADAVGQSLEALRGQGMAFPVIAKPDGGGRPGERWYPAHPHGDGDRPLVDNSFSPSPCPISVSGSASASWVVGSDDGDGPSASCGTPEETPGRELTLPGSGPATPGGNSPEDTNSPRTPVPSEIVSSDAVSSGPTPVTEPVTERGTQDVDVHQGPIPITYTPHLDPSGKPYQPGTYSGYPTPTKITAEWIDKHLILEPAGDGIRIGSSLHPDSFPAVAEWCRANTDLARLIAMTKQDEAKQFFALVDEVMEELV